MPKEHPLSPETRELVRAQLSRRGVIAGVGGLGAVGARREQREGARSPGTRGGAVSRRSPLDGFARPWATKPVAN